MGDFHYNQNYTREQIKEILDTIKGCLHSNRYSISKNENRQENRNFIDEYNMTSKKQKEILLNIQIEDFAHSLKNKNMGYEHEILYVFAPKVELFNAIGEVEIVDIYTKFNVIEVPSGKRTIVISFHKLNKPINYLFR